MTADERDCANARHDEGSWLPDVSAGFRRSRHRQPPLRTGTREWSSGFQFYYGRRLGWPTGCVPPARLRLSESEVGAALPSAKSGRVIACAAKLSAGLASGSFPDPLAESGRSGAVPAPASTQCPRDEPGSRPSRSGPGITRSEVAGRHDVVSSSNAAIRPWKKLMPPRISITSPAKPIQPAMLWNACRIRTTVSPCRLPSSWHQAGSGEAHGSVVTGAGGLRGSARTSGRSGGLRIRRWARR